MTLQAAHNILNFWIDKDRGVFYTPSELDDLLDIGQMALYNDLQPKASTSQRIKDALAPFKASYPITPANSLNGLVEIPEGYGGYEYLHLLNFEIRYAVSGRGITKYLGLQNSNEDEISERKSSQVDPVTVTSPVLEQMGKAKWQLTPAAQYFGSVSYYRRPLKPVYAYTLISGRVQVYDAANSVELEWSSDYHTDICIKALQSIGINLGDGDVSQFAAIASQNNYLGGNHT